MNCPQADTRSALQDHANAIATSMKRLDFTFSDGSLRELSGLWARAHRMIDAAEKPSDTPGGQSGAGEVLAQLEKLAA